MKQLSHDGFVILRHALGPEEVLRAVADLERALAAERIPDDAGVLRRGDAVFAVRKLLRLWPDALRLLMPLRTALSESFVGPFGVVRAALFDKPPRAAWFVPRHRDRAIAIRPPSARLPDGFARPTQKHGVFHVNAPELLLQRMLTVRLHLDPATAERGALRVEPGSHEEQLATRPDVMLDVEAGDAVLMRPLLVHASSSPSVTAHRRILHFEFAPANSLPGTLAWDTFIPL